MTAKDKITLLKQARAAIERKGNERNMPYQTNMVYSFGIRDACWEIDKLIEEITKEEQHADS